MDTSQTSPLQNSINRATICQQALEINIIGVKNATLTMETRTGPIKQANKPNYLHTKRKRI